MTYRCCMCPQTEQEKTVCKNGEPCRFVKRYIDDNNRIYKVVSVTGRGVYKAKRRDIKQTEAVHWKGIKALPWRNSFDGAQEELNNYAQKNGLQIYEKDV